MEWYGALEKTKEETERVLSENEQKEFRSRLAILASELNEKNQQIEQVNTEKVEMEQVAERAMAMGMQM